MKPRLSAVVISRNEGVWLARTVRSLQETLPPRSEIVVVDDGSDCGTGIRPGRGLRVLRTPGLGVARAHNLGLHHARGDIVVFCDAHVHFAPGWAGTLLAVLEDPKIAAVAPAVASTRAPDAFGCGMTWPEPDLEARWMPGRRTKPFPAPVLPGCCFMIRRQVLERAGGYDGALLSRGGIDSETCLRLWLLGYDLWAVPQARVWHRFRKRAPYRITLAEVLHNRLRLALVHFKPSRIARVLKAIPTDHLLAESLLMAMAGGVAERRQQLFAQRTRNDDWFFERFGIRW